MNYGKKETVSKKLSNRQSKRKKRNRGFAYILRSFLVICLLFIIMVGAFGIGALQSIIASAPDISDMSVAPDEAATFIYDPNGVELQKLNLASANRIYVTMDKIPQYLQEAVVATEDERFYKHNGIDLKGILRATVVNFTSGNFSEGASTITQQLLKNNVFSGWTSESKMESIQRKLQEQYLALQLEKQMSKKDILEYYLNTINLGAGTFGVQAASHKYFGKDVEHLTLSEATVIAGISQNPTRFNPIVNPTDNASRRKEVLNHLLTQEYITQGEYDEALADNVYDRIQANVQQSESEESTYSYFIDALIAQVLSDLQSKKGLTQAQALRMLYSGGLKIYATQDLALQGICDEEYANPENYPGDTQWLLQYALSVTHSDGTTENYSSEMLESYFKEENPNFNRIVNNEGDGQYYVDTYKATILKEGDKVIAENITYIPQPQSSFVLMDHTNGDVKAIVGGRGPKLGSLTLNRATDSTRQPGSTFKPLAVYAPGIDSGKITLASAFDDSEVKYRNSDQIVENAWKSYRGLTNVRTALKDSINTVAVRALTDISPELAFDYLKNFGFTTLVDREERGGQIMTDKQQALALGGITDGITNLEITAAYAAIANQGVYHRPNFYSKILDANGNVLLDNTESDTKHVLKNSTAFLMTNAMMDVVTRGTGTGFRAGDQPVSGKTGTTENNKDYWFCGFTPYYTASVWTGFDNSIEVPDSGRVSGQMLWSKIMTRVHDGLDHQDFVQPDSITTAYVCGISGQLAVQGLCTADPRGVAYEEYFAAGTQPTSVCTTHVTATVCTDTNLIATQYCEKVGTRVFIVRPTTTGVTDDMAYMMPNGYCHIHNAQTKAAADKAKAEKEKKEKEEKEKKEKEQKEKEEKANSSATEKPAEKPATPAEPAENNE